MTLKPEDRVRVKDCYEILKTLDSNRCYDGLLFGKEMEEHCGKVYTVRKEVKKILDFYNHGTRIFTDTYLLDGVYCEGTAEYPECDRMCFFFWKGEWLEKIS